MIVPEIEVVSAVQREALEFLIAAVVEIQHVAAGLHAAEAVSVPVIRGFHPAHGLGPPQALASDIRCSVLVLIKSIVSH